MLFFSPGLVALSYLLGLLSRVGQEPVYTSRVCAEPQGSPSPLLCRGQGWGWGQRGVGVGRLVRPVWGFWGLGQDLGGLQPALSPSTS